MSINVKPVGMKGARTSRSKPVRCKWVPLTKKCIKILGINFSYNKTLANKEKYYDLATDCHALVKHLETALLAIPDRKNSSIQIISCIETCICSINGIHFGQLCTGDEIFT